MDQLMTLAPSEYTGEPGTCVCGRVVLRRGPFKLDERREEEQTQNSQQGKASKGKEKGKKGKGETKAGKEKQPQEQLKMEVHLLGGQTRDEILFIDGWADGATQMGQTLVDKRVYRICGARKIDNTPKYSTSSLPYFLRVIPPIGMNTKVEEYTASPWAELALHHPFTKIQSLERTHSTMRHCLIGIITHQPGAVARDTRYGPGRVCNAVIKHDEHDIRCGFWRDHGEKLAQYGLGAAVALYQVLVYFANGSWEVGATESTVIADCPADLAVELNAKTDHTAAGISLTQPFSTDYDTVRTRPATLSGLASVLRPSQPRSLSGVFEIHSVAVVGVVAVLSNDNFQMQACQQCKATVAEDTQKCSIHPDAATEMRWIFSLELADQVASCKTMLYHDTASLLSFLTGDATDLKVRAKIVRAFRAVPWSVRLVFRSNEYRQQNYLEIKRMEPTLTFEGVVASFRLLPAPHVQCGGASPFACCAEVQFDDNLGAWLYSPVVFLMAERGRELSIERSKLRQV